MMTDATLLRDYVEKRDERAFAELVRRHLDLVYAAALRRTGGQRHLAEEISQKVFCDLSRKAPALTHHPALTGWLYRSTRYAAIDAARAETRRRKLAQTLTAMPDLSPASELPADWEKLRPVIDDAMDQLESRDRELMLLHYFNALTFAEAGAQLNLSGCKPKGSNFAHCTRNVVNDPVTLKGHVATLDNIRSCEVNAAHDVND